MRRHATLLVGVVLALLMGLASCEKMVVDSTDDTPTAPTDGNLKLRIALTGMAPMGEATRADGTQLADYFTKLCFVAYQDGQKVKGVSQNVDDASFGQVAMQLAPGTYQVLVVAHSSDGNPTLSNPRKIDFTNKVGFSDTFYWYGDVEVTDKAAEHTVTLERVSSMLRFIINDEVPSDVESFLFIYRGGSAAFDATTGWGNEASTQKVEVANEGQHVFELYTIVREDLDGGVIDLNLDVRANKKDGTVVSKEIKGVHMERNKITQYSGNFFSNGQGGGGGGGGGGTEEPDSIAGTFQIVVNTDWADTMEYEY